MSRRRKSKGSPLALAVTSPGDTPYRQTKIGDCTCGYRLPDLIIGATTPPRMVMICPDCGAQWELGLTRTTVERVSVLLEEERKPS